MTSRTVAYMTILLGCIYVFLKYVMSYVLPFVLGIFLAFMLEPIVSTITRRTRIERSKASLAAVFLLVLLVVSLITWTITRISMEISDLYGKLPEYRVEFDRVIAEIFRIAGDISDQLPEPLARSLQEQWNRLYSLLAALVSGAGIFVKSVPSFLITVTFTFLSTYFMLRDRAAIRRFARNIVSPGTFASLKDVELDILGGVAGFVRAEALLVVVTMILNVIALTLIGSRYAVALGLLLALLDLLPIVGPGLVYLPWIAYQFAWGSIGTGIGLLVLYGSVSLVRQVANTHLVGREMGLHPLVALVSVYVGFRLFGAAGLAYGPLTAILIKVLWASNIIPHEGGAVT
ncbi:MAG: sporulation integral membrane protein YtvI [Bacillota bacterium]